MDSAKPRSQLSSENTQHFSYVIPRKPFCPNSSSFTPQAFRALSSRTLVVSTTPTILTRSLQNQIISSFNLLKNLFHSDDKFIATFKKFPHIVVRYHSAVTFRVVEILREQGVPDSNIMYLLTVQPGSQALYLKHDRFIEVVEDVKKMGFNTSKMHFVIAVQALLSKSKLSWKRRMKVYEKWGWSEEETMLAFTRHPWCMNTSDEKIMAVMSFYVNTMGCDSSLIAHRPKLMSLSLGKRIIPRCSVLKVLLSKGLIKKPMSPLTIVGVQREFVPQEVCDLL